MLLNYQQASRVCEHYQYLIGNQIMRGWKVFAHIDAVVLCPFDEQSKYRFLEAYKLCKNGEEALSFYNGGYYDILLIGETTLISHDVTSMGLRKYLETQGQAHKFDTLVNHEYLLSE